MTERRKPRSYTDELKQQIVQLYHNGKRTCDIWTYVNTLDTKSRTFFMRLEWLRPRLVEAFYIEHGFVKINV